MASVTTVVKQTKQPQGGYLDPTTMQVTKLNMNKKLNDKKLEDFGSKFNALFQDMKQIRMNRSALIGLAVDYLQRMMIQCKNVQIIDQRRQAFEISERGAVCFSEYIEDLEHLYNQQLGIDIMSDFYEYADNINELDDISIINACKIVYFDTWYRNMIEAIKEVKMLRICEIDPQSLKVNQIKQNIQYYRRDMTIEPNAYTIENIRIMVERMLNFVDQYGPVIQYDFNFQPYGYTSKVTAGDGDILTKDTLWEIKTKQFNYSKLQKYNTGINDTLQLLMYYIMGKHSGNEIYDGINKIGIMNTRFNWIWTYDIERIPVETLREIETQVIGYDDTVF